MGKANKKIEDYLHLYLGCDVETPDGIGKLVGLPYSIVSQDRVSVHFGSKMIHTKNSIDGGYDKKRNHGDYAICAKRYEPIGSEGRTEDGFDMPGGIKPILRPLSDMTEREAKSIFDEGEQELIKKDFERWKRLHLRSLIYSADDFKNLLSKGFDLFGLIESGLAIDTLNVTPS